MTIELTFEEFNTLEVSCGKLTFENFCNAYMMLLPCAMGINTQIEILE